MLVKLNSFPVMNFVADSLVGDASIDFFGDRFVMRRISKFGISYVPESVEFCIEEV